jgi:dehydrogenase/reductase SDR family member 7B
MTSGDGETKSARATAAAGTLRGRRVLVTGASSGIGRALAERLARDGAAVALVGRDPERLRRAAAGCRAVGSPSVATYAFDLTEGEGISSLVATVIRDFGGTPDMLIHAAGSATAGRVEDTPAAAARDVLAVNLLAAMALASALLPGMRTKRAGHLVFLSSGTAHFGVPTEAAYCASKAGLERFVESLRAELAGSGILVSVVSPGPVETPLLRRPRIYGGVALVGRPEIAARPETAADRIVACLATGSARIELSWRSRLVRHFAYWAPALLGRLIARQSGVAGAAPGGSSDDHDGAL